MGATVELADQSMPKVQMKPVLVTGIVKNARRSLHIGKLVAAVLTIQLPQLPLKRPIDATNVEFTCAIYVRTSKKKTKPTDGKIHRRAAAPLRSCSSYTYRRKEPLGPRFMAHSECSGRRDVLGEWTEGLLGILVG